MKKTAFELKCDEIDNNPRPTNWFARIVAFPVALIVASSLVIYEAWVVMLLWNWFLLPVFGIALTFISAIALDLIVSLLVFSPRKRSMYEVMWGIGMILKVVTTTLVIGWLLHLFV